MSTKNSSNAEKLAKIAKAMEKAKSKTEIRRLNIELDAILGMEESPPPEDPELMEEWERHRK